MAKYNMSSIGLGNGMLSEISQSLKQSFETHNININDIVENENNKYSVDDVDDLVDSIRTVGGLKQNLDVMKMPNGKYKLLTGHRRIKALRILAKEEKKYEIAPCTITDLGSVELPVSDDMKEQYLITITNSTQRSMTDADKYNQYLDLKAIYTEAKSNGYTLSTKMRNLIAKDMDMSPAQIGKMDYINNNADDSLKKRLLKNQVSIAQANEIAHDAKEKTTKKNNLLDELTEDSYTLSLDEINALTITYSDFTQHYKDAAQQMKTINREHYAKLLKCKRTIIKEIEKMEKLIKIKN